MTDNAVPTNHHTLYTLLTQNKLILAHASPSSNFRARYCALDCCLGAPPRPPSILIRLRAAFAGTPEDAAKSY